MNKWIPIAVFALVGTAVGVALYFALFREKPVEPPEQELQEKSFDPVAFMERFDLNGDDAVEWDQFRTSYGTTPDDAQPAFLISSPGKAAVKAEQAFAAMDLNKNGKVDAAAFAQLEARVARLEQRLGIAG